jgi:PKD repeat protein
MGMYFSGVKNASAHHNLFAHNHARQPQFSVLSEGEVINNVVYNYGDYATEVQSGAKVSVIGNYYKAGVDWAGFARGINVQDPDPNLGPVSVYVQGNVGPGRLIDEGDDWNAVTGNSAYRSVTPPVPLSGVTSTTASDAYMFVTANAGAFPRDSVDRRILYDILHNSGAKIVSQGDVGGWPVLTGTPPADSDNDGMSNGWENSNGLDPFDRSDANQLNGDGYTNLEAYMNSLIVPEPTVAYAGSDQSLCNTTTTAMAASVPFLGTGNWRLVSGGGIVTLPTSATSTVTGLPLGVNKFEWRIVYNGLTTSRDTVSITTDPAPTVANAGPDKTPCNVTSTSLDGNTPTTGTGLWRVVYGTATITNPANPSTSVTALQPGLTKFEWSITGSSSCPVSRDTVIVTVSALPTVADAGVDQLKCDNATAVLNGNRAVVGTGQWTVLVGSAIIDDPFNNDPKAIGLSSGPNVFEWAITNGTCPVSRDTVTVTFQYSPTSDFSWTKDLLTVHFTSLATNATTYLWDFADGTTSTEQNPVHTFLLLRSYRVSLTVSNVCGSQTRKRRVNLGVGSGMLSITPDAIDFGDVPVNDAATGSVVVMNPGEDTLDIDAISLDESSPEFSINAGGFSLGPEDIKVLDVSFSPLKEGFFTGQMDVQSDVDTATVAMAGTGVQDSLYIPLDELTQSGVDFGAVPTGGSSVRMVRILYPNQPILRIDSITVAPDGRDRMSVVKLSKIPAKERALRKSRDGDHLPLTLLDGDAAAICLQYSPKAIGLDSSSVTMYGGGEQKLIRLTGTGTLIRTQSTRQTNGAQSAEPSVKPVLVQTTPDRFEMQQNYPNPFNNSTTIYYSLKEDTRVTIRVFSTLGEEVTTLIDDFQSAGFKSVLWDGRNKAGEQASSGIYIYRMSAGDFVKSGKMIFLK